MSVLSKITKDRKIKKSQIFTESGTWVKPAGVDFVDVLIVGGGGGGGCATYSTESTGWTVATGGGFSGFSSVYALGGGQGGPGFLSGNPPGYGGVGGGVFGGSILPSSQQNGSFSFVSSGGGAGAGYYSPTSVFTSAGSCVGFAITGRTARAVGGSSYGLGGFGYAGSTLPETGGGGCGGEYNNNTWGGGGGGGEVVIRTGVQVTDNVSVIVGSGGAGGGPTLPLSQRGQDGGAGLVAVMWVDYE